MKPNSLQELYVEQLKDLYDAEHQIIKALPKMIDEATSDDLKEALTEHLQVTKTQATRLEEIFESSGEKAKAEKCKGMQGVIQEGSDLIGDIEDDDVRDAAIIALKSGSVRPQTAARTCTGVPIAPQATGAVFAIKLSAAA